MRRHAFISEPDQYLMDFYNESNLGNNENAPDVSDGQSGARGGPGLSSCNPDARPSSSSSSSCSSRGPLSSLGGPPVGAVHQMQPSSSAVPNDALLAKMKALRDQGISLDQFFDQQMISPPAQAPSVDMSQSHQAAGTLVAAAVAPENAEPVPPPMGNTSAESESEVAQFPAPNANPATPEPQGEDEAKGPVTPEKLARKSMERMRKTVFGKRKRKNSKGDPASENFRKRPRKTYTDEQKKYLMNAYKMGGALAAKTVAASMGMHWGSAQNIIRKQKHGEQAGLHDMRQGNPGRKSKLTDVHIELIHDLLQTDAGRTREEIRKVVNTEIFREKMLERLPHHPTLFSAAEIQKIEESNDILDEFMSRAPPDIILAFENEAICADSTIGSALKNSFYSVKTIVKEKASVNSVISMKKRLDYCTVMSKMLENPKYFIIFQDEMPFYFTMMRKKGWAPKGRRAVALTPPVSNMSYRTQVSMAVNQDFGLLLGEAFLPEKATGFNKRTGEPTKESWKTSWSKEKFIKFMENLLRHVYEKREHYEVKGKIVGLVVDGAPDHGGKGLKTLLSATDAWKTLDDYLKEGDANAKVEIYPAPPNSPQLNLCEYYNRTLRMRANAARHQPENAAKLLGDYRRGEKMENRVAALASIINTELAKLKTQPNQTRFTQDMHKFFRDVIADNGYLDWRRRMG